MQIKMALKQLLIFCIFVSSGRLISSFNFPECRVSESGVEYRGTQDITGSGKACKAWSDLTRRELKYAGVKSIDEQNNYCRNPDESRAGGPWCFVEGKEGDWEYCDIPFCKPSASCRRSKGGQEYAGTISRTENGRVCQRWDVQSPHSHNYTSDDFVSDASMKDANNYCRDPSQGASGLWCFTTDPEVEWEYCDIDMCSDCKVSDAGETYFGSKSVTSSGHQCQPWNQQTPHQHDMTDESRFPDADVEAAENFCRNPDRRTGGPWCFTTNSSVEWEHCDIPLCSSKPPTVQRARHVLHIGIDGLKPSCIADAPGGAPNMLKRMKDAGSSTLTNARTGLSTMSAPGWTSTLCGMKSEEHGVTDNNWVPPWISEPMDIAPITGNDVPFPCVFDQLKSLDSNVQTAMFYSWQFLEYIGNTGRPNTVDEEFFYGKGGPVRVFNETDFYVVGNATNYLRNALKASTSSYTYVYLLNVDDTGHRFRWCHDRYLQQVANADYLVGELLDLIDDLGMTDEVVVMLSSDHGGLRFGHGRMADSDILVPMFLKGPGIKKGHEIKQYVNVIDMVPTAFHLMGQKVNPIWTGRVMKDAVEADVVP